MRKNEKWQDGTEILRITSNRNFSYAGVRYYVSNTCRQDAGPEGFRYNLNIVDPDGSLSLACDAISWETLKFKTIKDARRWVRDWFWNIKKWDL